MENQLSALWCSKLFYIHHLIHFFHSIPFEYYSSQLIQGEAAVKHITQILTSDK